MKGCEGATGIETPVVLEKKRRGHIAATRLFSQFAYIYIYIYINIYIYIFRYKYI